MTATTSSATSNAISIDARRTRPSLRVQRRDTKRTRAAARHAVTVSPRRPLRELVGTPPRRANKRSDGLCDLDDGTTIALSDGDGPP